MFHRIPFFSRRLPVRLFGWLPTLVLAGGALLGTGCSDSDGDGQQNGDDNSSAGGAGGTETPRYALSSMLFDDMNTSTYVNLLDSVDVDAVSLDDAREFPGAADLWFHEGSLFVAEGEGKSISKLAIESGKLVATATVGFGNYGVTDFGFWRNAFVGPKKALFLSGTSEYIVWDPATTTIAGSFELPELPAREGLTPFPGYSDRAALQRGKLLYQPVYYTDESFFRMAPASSILVVDTERDEVVDVLEAPCPGLDFASRDEDDNLYFSSWIFAPGGAAVLDQPTTCVVKLARGSDVPELLFKVADVADGRQGGVFRYLGDGKAYLSVLHAERSTSADASEVSNGPNWRFWLYDFASGSAQVVDGIDFNAGAAYASQLGGKPFMMVPAGDYTSTQLYAILPDGSVAPKLVSPGWSVRLFELR